MLELFIFFFMLGAVQGLRHYDFRPLDPLPHHHNDALFIYLFNRFIFSLFNSPIPEQHENTQQRCGYAQIEANFKTKRGFNQGRSQLIFLGGGGLRPQAPAGYAPGCNIVKNRFH